MSPPPPFRVAKSKGTPKKTTKTGSQTTNSPSISPQISLEAYIANIFFDVIIQDQDDIAELVLKRNFTPNIKEK